MKYRKKLHILFFLILFLIPINVFAYSKEIIPGGNTIGIEVNSNGVLVVGFYKVNDSYIGRLAGFEIGDKILKLNGKEINTIDSMIDTINSDSNEKIKVTVERNKKTTDIDLELQKDKDGILKTGLYVKDTITGIGTLTYIDPNTKIFGALGHEIIEKTTEDKFDIKGGIIFDADVVGIEKSDNGRAGEKNAEYNKTEIFGNIKENEVSGIFGTYTNNLDNLEKVEVADIKDIKTGKAKIKTVLENENVEEFEINIIKLDDTNETKNILFEVTDENLLSKTGGIVQGMSGSPILQDGKIIGAVTHVIVNDPKKGYGIFIKTMLEEGDK